MTRHYTAALPIAYVILRLLVILNWLVGAAILALLFVLPNEQWIMKAFELKPSPDTTRLVWGLRGVAALGLVTIPLHYMILKRLIAMIDTVRTGDPFVADNAYRLQAIAWVSMALQIISLIIAGIANAVSTPAHPLNLDAGFSVGGWLAVLFAFILARIFAEGTLMRADLDGTI